MCQTSDVQPGDGPLSEAPPRASSSGGDATTSVPASSPARSPRVGFAYALAGTLIISTNFITSKFALRGFNPESFSLVWTASGALYALALAAGSGRIRELRPAPGAALKLVALGALTGAGMMLTWSGIALLDPSFAAFLWRLMPVLNILSGVLVLGERLMWIEALPMVLMLAGVLASTLGRWEAVGSGLVFTLAAVALSAPQMLLAKLILSRMTPGSVVFHRLAGAAVVISIWTAATGRGEFAAPWPQWTATLAGAFIGPFLAHILIFRAYRVWELSRASLVEMAQPLFVLPLAFAFLRQTPSARELLGGGLIFAGAAWIASMQLRKKRR